MQVVQKEKLSIIDTLFLLLFFLNFTLLLIPLNELYPSWIVVLPILGPFFYWFVFTGEKKKQTLLLVRKVFSGFYLVIIVVVLLGLNMLYYAVDNDTDGLAIGKEILSRTSLLNPDTDRDLMKDGIESTKKSHHFNPLDWDNDHNKVGDICDLIGIHKLKHKDANLTPLEVMDLGGLRSICQNVLSDENIQDRCYQPENYDQDMIEDLKCKDVMFAYISHFIEGGLTQYEK